MLSKLITLFISFFKIGLFTFGGGHSMIALITQEAAKNGFITYSEIIDMIAISESTPGPFAINIATFVGKNYAGVIGSITATMAVALPSFIIIAYIAKYFDKIKENEVFRKTLSNVLPVAIALVTTSGISIAVYALSGINFSLRDFGKIISSVDIRLLGIFVVVAAFTLIMDKKKKSNPIAIILLGAILGVVVFSLF